MTFIREVNISVEEVRPNFSLSSAGLSPHFNERTANISTFPLLQLYKL